MGRIPRMKHEPNQLSVRSNELIQNSRYQLTVWEEDIITFMSSFLDPYKEEFTPIEFTIKDFYHACGIESDGGKNYKKFKDAITQLLSRVIWIPYIDEKGNQAEKAIHWLSEAIIIKNTGKFKGSFSTDLKPYFLRQKKNFTMFEIIYAMHLRQEYDKRLYMYCKSRQYQKLESYTFQIPINKLKEAMGEGSLSDKGVFVDTSYSDWSKFKERRLDPAIRRINEGTDIDITYVSVKEGKTVVDVELTVTTKDMESRLRIHQKLRLGSHSSELSTPEEIPLLDESVVSC